MKKCTKCKLDKSKSEFNKNSWKLDGLQTICRICSSKRSRQYYAENREKHKKVTHKRRKARRKDLKQRIHEIKAKCGCATCDEKDTVCLEFHHCSGKKEFTIASAYSYEWGWSKVLKEIEKCVCLCANCHRKVHASRFEITLDMLCKNKINLTP